MYVFFFKQKTAYEMRISDWSSDVCSSDLILALLERRAQAIAAPLFACGRDWRFTPTASGLRYEDAEQAIDLPKPSLPGRHQIAKIGRASCRERVCQYV